MIQEFARHMVADAKQLEEDEKTGAKAYRYVRTGTDHFSLAFTYDCVTWSRDRCRPWVVFGGSDEPYWDPILHAKF